MHIALAPFELKPGVSEDVLLTASDRFQQEFACNQDGIIRRVLVKDGDGGGYADFVFFRDLESIDRVIADRYVNQCSTLKSRDELVVFDRIDGDATVAQAQHAVIFRAVSGGGVPVWMQDPFKRRRVINVTVVGGNAWSTATIMFR